MQREERPILTTAKRKKDRRILVTVVSCFLVALVIGIILSYATSRHADQAAVSSGSSTSRKAPNTLQDHDEKAAEAATTGTTSNVPPAKAQQ